MKNNKKHCPAIVGIYYMVDKIKSPTEISHRTGIAISSVHQILNRKYGVTNTRVRKSDDLIMQIEHEYLSGVSTYEMADKYGVDHSTISKWMKRRGHSRGRGNHSKGKNKGHETQRVKAIAKLKEKAFCDSGGTIELTEYVCKEKQTFICHVCGQEFTHGAGRGAIRCPFCENVIREQIKADRDKQREEARIKREHEYAKEKVCASCGAIFHSEYATQLYCSDTCSRREKRHRDVASGKTKLTNYNDHRKRARKYGVPYKPGITLAKLIERDGNMCQICGGQCDTTDRRYGFSGPLYPSIDHIKPMSKGGSHTWDNVQLAHVICNSYKRDIYNAEEYTA